MKNMTKKEYKKSWQCKKWHCNEMNIICKGELLCINTKYLLT